MEAEMGGEIEVDSHILEHTIRNAQLRIGLLLNAGYRLAEMFDSFIHSPRPYHYTYNNYAIWKYMKKRISLLTQVFFNWNLLMT